MVRAALAVALLALLAGCSVGGGPGEGDAEVAGTYGYLTIERGAEGSAAKTTAIARFVHARAGVPDDSALRLAGIDRVFPALGSCASLEENPSTASGVDLADFGPVLLQHDDGTQTVLGPRSVPDPVGTVSGVFFYGVVDGAPSRLALHFRGDVAIALGPPPKDLGDVRVTSTTSGFDVSWEADDAGDAIYADVLGEAARVRCALADTGRAIVPALASERNGTLTLRRVRRISFQGATATGRSAVSSTEGGEARYDVTRSIAFRREP